MTVTQQRVWEKFKGERTVRGAYRYIHLDGDWVCLDVFSQSELEALVVRPTPPGGWEKDYEGKSFCPRW